MALYDDEHLRRSGVPAEEIARVSQDEDERRELHSKYTHRGYKVVRFYRDHYPSRRTIERNLTLAEAQRHCQDPETSSSTCTKSHNTQRTRKYGPWFDGYEKE